MTAPASVPPPPPPPPPPAPRDAPAPLVAGQLTPGWRSVFLTGWAAVVAAFGAVWYSCRVAGIAPWWLGPETDPRFVLVIALPFIPPTIAIIAASTGSRWSCHIGVAAGLALAAVPLGDRHFPGLALVELVIAIAAIMLSIAGFGGRLRRNRSVVRPPDDVAAAAADAVADPPR